MTGRGEDHGVAGILGPAKGRGELALLILATLARTLAQESDPCFLWLPVVFAAALITGERSGIMDETNQACPIQRPPPRRADAGFG